jgi:hypothetical protein
MAKVAGIILHLSMAEVEALSHILNKAPEEMYPTKDMFDRALVIRTEIYDAVSDNNWSTSP